MARHFEKRSPVEEAELDSANNDSRIYAIQGLGLFYPGLDPRQGERLAKQFGHRVIPGITDAIEGPSQERLAESATRFAEAYNQRKAELLTEPTP